MSSRCKNCGGTLIYDISLEKVKCEFCSSVFEPESFNSGTAADESGENLMETTEFTCPNCGAQVASAEFDSIDYCMYCGSFVSLESQMKKLRRPDKILPFSRTKEECRKSYRKSLRKRIYAPQEFRDESFIEGFKGVYVPFWNYEYSYGPEIKLKGETETREGDYIYTQHFETMCKASGHVENSVYDASSNFDDTVSLRIAPYPKDKIKDFNTSYMFGFYGDTADISDNLYRKDSDQEVETRLWDDLTGCREAGKGHFLSSKPASFVSDVNMKKSTSLVMLPVWFLTWRKGDRIAYSAVNGETGEAYTETPIDMLRYIVISILTAVPIFFLLNAAVTFSAKNMLAMSMLLSIFMGIVYIFELDKIVRRVMHTDDRGFLAKHEDAKKASDESVSDNLFTILWEFIKDTVAGCGLYFIVLAAGAIFVLLDYVTVAIVIVAVSLPIYSACRLRKNIKILKDKTVWIDISGIAFSLIYGTALLLIDPAPDLPFYIASLFGMAGVGFAALRMAKRYNELITRPIPHFFEHRKGGNAS